jgi:hypothetical protein
MRSMQMSRFCPSPAQPLVALLVALASAGAACSDDDSGDGGSCDGGGGPVMSSEPDTHCKTASGMDVVQTIGMCVTAADDTGAADDEEFGVFYGREADDDDCKYHVSFTNTCIQQNQPVTFTVKLTRKSDGSVAAGALPSNPEIYMEADNHLSPSNNIKAPESPSGTYAIGPIEFDRPGRWVVRFHFFETCSDIPDDAPHGHAAFYIDVP